jgi:L-seryl-tRNA(Ser) seleniumtransferase
MENPFRNLPSVNQLLESPQLKKLVGTISHNAVVDGVRTFLDEMRDQINTTKDEVVIPTATEMAEKISSWLANEERPYLCPVINATGIILHTGLGRAPLAKSALEAIREMAGGYCSIETNLKTGERGQRSKAVERILRELTGAEAAIVVNNNAAATTLTLAGIAHGKEVIVSRGEMIEIGGSYRLPEVMEFSGAKLREIGTTNKTRLSDYESAISENTGAILKVHPSNFMVVGFVESVPLKKLCALANQSGLPLIDDIGSGALIDFSKYGVADEPVARARIEAGADVVLFSGDKLLGGPQCGIIIGKRKFVSQILKHPLARAFRVDKLTLAALAETLRLYRDLDTAEQEIPVLRMLSMPVENLKLRAEKVRQLLTPLPGLASIETIEDVSMLGGGSMPTQKIRTFCVAIQATDRGVDRLAERMRMANPPVIGRICKERLLLDMRTVMPEQDQQLVAAFESVLIGEKSKTTE